MIQCRAAVERAIDHGRSHVMYQQTSLSNELTAAAAAAPHQLFYQSAD